MGIKSLIGLPKRIWAGESFVSLSGVLRYCSIARWNLSVCKVPLGPVLSISNRFIVFTPSSARQLLCGNATEDCLWRTPQSERKSLVSFEVYSDAPSEAISSAMPNVEKVVLRHFISPLDPSSALSTTGQLEYLSTTTK